MITDSFDNQSAAKINPQLKEGALCVDACIVTFSYMIEKFVLENYKCEQIGQLYSVTGITPLYQIDYNNKKFAFYKTYVGAPACVGAIEDTLSEIKTNKYILFGGCGCLNREITHGKVIIPTEAYRDEGTSYHYAPASDYIKVANAPMVAKFMEENGIPFAVGKTWTTDALYRETINNFEKRKAEGCISVEMECSGVQAMCNFRNLELYMFFTSGDLLDAPEWDTRCKNGQIAGTQHDTGHFNIAIALADYISSLNL
ncbi:MAG: nucleoside phosphorylase [Bacillota bacterium]|nr:nucleoside phosphorylase [Bacillota bacterium]